MTDIVDYQLSDGVARILMDDGKANIMSLDMLIAVAAAFDQAERDHAAVILCSGRSGLFSAGFDLKVLASGDVEASLAMVRSGAELALKLLQFPRPIIAAVNGHAFPMGTFLLLACDARIGAQGTYRMGLNEVAIGISPPSFAIELARSRIHPAWLSRTVTLGEMFQPEEALAAGFLDKIVPAADLNTVVETTATVVAKFDPAAHRLAKTRLRAHSVAAIRAAIDEELTLDAYKARPPSSITVPRSG